jgi:hypothetical protein
MKSVILIICCLLDFSNFNKVNASFIITPGSTIYPETWKNLKASEFVMLSAKDFSKITGKKLSLKDRIAFSVMKIKMKHAIKKNKNLTMGEYLATSKKLSIGWVVLITVVCVIVLVSLIILISYGRIFTV